VQKICHDKVAVLFKQQEKTRFQGNSCKFTAIMEQDMKHMLNNIMLHHNGILPMGQLKQVFKFVIGIVTSRHTCKIESIAASSREIKFKVINGIVQCQMPFFCYKKGKGFGKFPCKFMKCKELATKVNLVCIALIFSEKRDDSFCIEFLQWIRTIEDR